MVVEVPRSSPGFMPWRRSRRGNFKIDGGDTDQATPRTRDEVGFGDKGLEVRGEGVGQKGTITTGRVEVDTTSESPPMPTFFFSPVFGIGGNRDIEIR